MPLHDWTRVGAHAYHHFHTFWLTTICLRLNAPGVLPAGYYTRVEQTTRTMGPDVLTLQSLPPGGRTTGAGGTATRPQVRFAQVAGPRPTAGSQKRLTIRHASGDRVVALVELVSPGNKGSNYALRSFVTKVVRAVDANVHVLVVDPFPPTRRDPEGIHGVIWPELGGTAFALPPDKRLTLAAYESGTSTFSPHRCYVEPIAVGDVLPDMPLFLEPDEYVNVPLELSYTDAWAAVLPQDRAALGVP